MARRLSKTLFTLASAVSLVRRVALFWGRGGLGRLRDRAALACQRHGSRLDCLGISALATFVITACLVERGYTLPLAGAVPIPVVPLVGFMAFAFVVLWVASLDLRGPRWLGLARLRAGRCPACGYDLRATPDRCPECGAAGGGG